MFNLSLTLSGLTSYSFSAPSAGIYMMDVKVQLPELSQGASAPSALVMTVTNGTGPVTIFTSSAGASGMKVDFVAAANDVITIALTSAAAVDAGLNVIKANIAISSGV